MCSDLEIFCIRATIVLVFQKFDYGDRIAIVFGANVYLFCYFLLFLDLKFVKHDRVCDFCRLETARVF